MVRLNRPREGATTRIRMFKSLPAAFGLLAIAAACSTIREAVPIVRDIKPVPAMELAEICIQTNHDVAKHRFDDDLAAVLAEMGFTSKSKEGAFRGECSVWMSYEASYAGRMPSYLNAVTVTLFEGAQRLGYFRYDASQGHGRWDRHGTTVSKLRPLLNEMLAEVVVPDR